MPVGVMVYREKFDAWRPGAHAGTFRGNQIGLVAGTAGMRFSKEVSFCLCFCHFIVFFLTKKNLKIDFYSLEKN